MQLTKSYDPIRNSVERFIESTLTVREAPPLDSVCIAASLYDLSHFTDLAIIDVRYAKIRQSILGKKS